MRKDIDESLIHQGHRSRMKSKLLTHGQKIFDTYELLEMLLYHVIPYKDTNGMAKRLLSAFGGLDGVLSAEKTDLQTVNGIGERASELIKQVDRLNSIIGAEILPRKEENFANYDAVGKYFVDYFANTNENCVVAMFLDNGMRLLSIKRLYDLEYSSAGVRPKAFIDEAVRTRASVIISAHNHPYGPFYPTQGDRATNNALSSALAASGFIHAEHYIICGNNYAGLGSLSNFNIKISQMPAVDEFWESRNNAVVPQQLSSTLSNSADLSEITLGEGSYNVQDFDYFTELLSFCLGKEVESYAKILLPKYRTIENVLTASSDEITTIAGEKTAFFLKLLAYVTSRRKTDRFKPAKEYSQSEIADYLKAIFLGESVEKTYIIGYDSQNRFIGCYQISEGTVSASEILPRKAVEIAVSKGCASVSIAHNHPFGTTRASIDDINVTRTLDSVFNSCGIIHREHFIIAGQLCNVLKTDALVYKTFDC